MEPITVIGSLNMDLVVRTSKAPQAGETLTGSDFHLIPGGKGANQAVAAARAGAQTHMVGCIGADAFGPVLLESLTRAGVNVAGVTRLEDVSSGTATIIVEDSGENRIIIVPGANGRVSKEVIQNQWRSIQQSGLILLQHEIPLETVHYIIERAHMEGIGVNLNPAPIYLIPQYLLSKIEVMVLNEVEAAALTGLPVTGPAAALQAAKSLFNQGVKTVILTLGAQGAILYSEWYELYQPAFKVEAVDTTAAGDTFTGSYAASILSGKAPPEALLYATAASALAVTHLGAQTSIPAREEVEAFIANHPNNQQQSSAIHQKGGG